MLEKLKEYPNTLRKLFNYLKGLSIEPIAFVRFSEEQQLGYYLLFLSNLGVNIEVNAYGCIAYFLQLGDFIRKEEWNDALVIYKYSYDKDTELLIHYNKCIVESFKRLENPF